MQKRHYKRNFLTRDFANKTIQMLRIWCGMNNRPLSYSRGGGGGNFHIWSNSAAHKDGFRTSKSLKHASQNLHFPLEMGSFMTCNENVVEFSIYNVEFLLIL